MKPAIVVATYLTKEGKGTEFEQLLAKHVPTLQELGFATSREPIIGRSKDGSYIEIFEWQSDDAPRRAHDHPDVAEIWEKMAAIAKFGTLSALAESAEMFPHFEPKDL